MHLNTEVVPLGLPEKVDLADRLWLLSHAPAVGAVTHEAAHARHTRWDPRELIETYGATRKMVDVITTLEEPRIEAQAVRFHADSRLYLRGCAMEIVARDFHISDTRYGAATAAALLLARVDARVLTKAEVRTFRTDIRKVLGDTLDELEPLWQRFLMLRDEDYEGMVEIAAAWLDALGEDPEDASNMAGESMMGEALPGDPGEGEGSGEGEGGSEDGEGEGSGDGEPKAAKGFGDKIMGKVHVAEGRMDKEVTEERGAERGERRRAEREADSKRRAEGERPHAGSFGKIAGGLHGYTPGGFSHYLGSRPPTSDERRAAKTLARLLEKIDYRDRAVSKVTSVVPPGRLRGRMAVQAEAYSEQGRDASGVEVWSGKRRKRVESTPLTIGFMGDISGSMGAAMNPLASTQWVISTAGAHIDARMASVHFGDKVHGVTPMGVREKSVRVFSPRDGTEVFRDAALALDRELTLLDGRGARIVFIASDGVFVDDRHAEYARTWMPLAARKGVAVIFLDFDGAMPYGSYGAAVLDCKGKTPSAVAALCGKAAIAEVRRIDARI
jgi:hypothetical protein